jgi:hypothetical protein
MEDKMNIAEQRHKCAFVGLCMNNKQYFLPVCCCLGHAVAQLVEALRRKPEGREFDFRWGNWNFLL